MLDVVGQRVAVKRALNRVRDVRKSVQARSMLQGTCAVST